MTALVIADLLLALGACLRLTRFIVADDVPGTWWIKDPLHDRKHTYQRRYAESVRTNRLTGQPMMSSPEPRWARYLEGLGCPFCISVWMAAAVSVSLLLVGGPGDAADWWRWVSGFLTLAWLTGHIAARAGDTEDD